MYANVIVDAGTSDISQLYTYRIPDDLVDAAKVGACVAVPFGGRKVVGYIFEIINDPQHIENIKDIYAVVSEAYVFSPNLLNLIRWMSEYYVAPLAHSMRTIVPEAMSGTIKSIVELIDKSKASPKSEAQAEIIRTLEELGGSADLDALRSKCGISRFGTIIRQLSNKGCVRITQSLELPKARPLIIKGLTLSDTDIDGRSLTTAQTAILNELSKAEGVIPQSELLERAGTSLSPIRTLIDKGVIKKVDIEVRRRTFDSRATSNVRPELTSAQKNALAIINIPNDLTSGNKTLVYGVTGSGKTEVYFQAIQEALEMGRSSICLVPEISLTTHLMNSYISRFGDQVAVLHSKLSTGERYDEWRRIERGEARVVLGARSAVFAPAGNLGLIVVDEEHESSYKQDRSPRYNAKRVAEERCNIEDAALILGSATPSIESFYRASSGSIKLAVMDRRINDRPLASTITIDQREEFNKGQKNIFSEALREAIEERLTRHEQAILFVNRRGYAHFMLCRTCGHTEKCPNCDVSLTYHAYSKTLRCHHCDEVKPAPTVCPNCGSPYFRQFGIGTERVEEEARRLFPNARVIRMDADTTRRKNSHAKLLDIFRNGKADILVGTQMVAKGLDFHNVTLVGVISADTILNMPDFRAAERTFQLLTQVSGRAGRGDIPGEVYVQSFSPDHYAIRAAAKQDYLQFYEQEIQYRSELMYPPFSQLINILSQDIYPEKANQRLDWLANMLKGKLTSGIEIMGPVSAPIPKLRGLYRSHLLVRNRHPNGSMLQEVLHEILDSMSTADKNSLIIDVDPLSML